MAWWHSPQERDTRDKEVVAEKKGVDVSDLKECPDCKGGYNGLMKCYTCDGEGQIER